MATKRKTQPEAKPEAAPEAAPTARRYRVAAAVPRRYRAGLGPFGPAPVEVELDGDQLAAIEADPLLTVTAVDG